MDVEGAGKVLASKGIVYRLTGDQMVQIVEALDEAQGRALALVRDAVDRLD